MLIPENTIAILTTLEFIRLKNGFDNKISRTISIPPCSKETPILINSSTK